MQCRVLAGAVAILAALPAMPASADMMDMTGVEPWDMCGSCHGVDGAGNTIKFPRLAGQPAAYIIKQLDDFRQGRRSNDGGQMQAVAGDLDEQDIGRVAAWFAAQRPPWPESTMAEPADEDRARRIVSDGLGDIPACLSCHGAQRPPSRRFIAPRIAGQRDFYIAKQLADSREGRRTNDPDGVMRAVAQRLSEADVSNLAAYLSRNPQLHERLATLQP